MMANASRSRVVTTIVLAGFSLNLGCASPDGAVSAGSGTPTGAARAEDLLVVDCKLPGQVRKLGQNAVFMTARQAIKTTGRDCEIRGGEYVSYDRANYRTALGVWLPLAEQGDLAAQTYVGEIYEKGLGVAPDYDAAATWYQRAAEKGYSRAALNLGYLYEQGLGRPKDPVQALNWYRRASGLKELAYNITPAGPSAEVTQLQNQVAAARNQLLIQETKLNETEAQAEPLRQRVQELQREVDTLREKVKSSPAPTPPIPVRPAAPSEPPAPPGGPSAKPAEPTPPTGGVGGDDRGKDEAALAAKQAEIAVLQQQIDSMQGDRGQRQEVLNLQRALAQAQAELVPLKAGLQPVKSDMPTGNPRIELNQVQLIEPQMVISTRGLDAKPSVPAGKRSWLVVGRVATAPDIPLKSVLVNQRPRTIDRNNTFRAELTEADRQLRIVATDRRDRSSTLEFSLPALTTSRREAGEATPVQFTATQLSQLRRSAGTYHALVIGNNGYRQLPRLRTAVADASDVAKVLGDQYRFDVKLLTDSTRYGILSALNDLRGKLTSEDNLLIYYAGHGHLDERSGRGYWLPIDAEQKSNANWIANEDITSILDAMNVRQLLLVADSCYSGTLTRSSLGQLEPGMTQEESVRVIQQMAQRRSRLALTSGGVAPVPDSAGGSHSAFAEIFLKVLRDNESVLVGRDLFRQVQLQMADMAARLPFPQEPQYAPMKPGHEGGDFVLLRPSS